MARGQQKFKPMEDGELVFHMEKSAYFRVIHCDGAFGGPAPSVGAQLIHMAIFSERNAFPKQIVHQVEGGSLGAELLGKRQGRKGVFREIEADLVMSRNTAAAIRDWLTEKIAAMDESVSFLQSQAAQAQRASETILEDLKNFHAVRPAAKKVAAKRPAKKKAQ